MILFLNGRFRLNKDSKVSYTQSGVSVFSHPYEKLLQRLDIL